MRDESEEARLMGDRTNSSSMVYTDGPRAALPEAGVPPAPTPPPPYERTIMGGPKIHTDKLGRKSSKACQDSELLNELMNYSGTTLMTQFHSDALKQVGYGKYQMLMILIAGLAVSAEVVQMFALYFVLPSANVEYCMEGDDKEVLIIINFLALGFGAMNIGGIAEINGRKRTLLSCLICMTLFSIVSAFMPTYGPFLMARLCASTFAGAIFPIGATYIGEITPGSMRGRSLAMYSALGVVGATVAAATSIMLLPLSGEELMLEHREHFSAWHRYLLIVCFSSAVPIIGMIILPESPRWLLDVGREVEALEIYQKIYTANRTNGRYTLTELELPGMRSERRAGPKSVLAIMASNAYQFCDSFGSLLRPPYKNTTVCLMIIWFFAGFVSYGLSVYVARCGRASEEQLFNSRTVTIYNNTFENITLTMNIVNQNFESCRFYNCTFEQMFLSYVQFDNCTFLNTNFHGVKTGNTSFSNTFFNYVNFIDTDLGEQNFIKCAKNNTKFDRMIGGCEQQFDFNIFTRVNYKTSLGCVVPSLIFILLAGEYVHRLGRVRVGTITITTATLLCGSIGFICVTESFYWTVGIIQSIIIACLFAVTVFSTEYYCTYLRCSALGFFVASAQFGAVLGGRLYLQMPVGDNYIVAVISIACLSLPSIATTILRETSQLL